MLDKKEVYAEPMNQSRQIKLGAIMAYFSIALNILSGLIYTPWMVSQIGQSDYGIYALVVSFISFFAIDFGLGSAVSRFLSKYKAVKDKKGEKRFLGIAFKLFTLVSILILISLIIVFFFIEKIYIGLTNDEIEKLKVVYVISGTFTVVSFPFKPFDGMLIADERFVFIKFIELVQKILTVILMMISLLCGYGLYSLVFVNALVGLLKVIIQYVYLKRYTYFEVDFSYYKGGLYKEIFGFSFWTTIIGVAQRFILNITPTILGVLTDTLQIALFSVGMTIEGYTWTISNALGGLFLPKVMRITENSKNMNEIEELLIKVGRLQLMVVGLIILGFGTLGLEFMHLWMGNEYSDSYFVALLLILTGFVTLTEDIAYTTLVALNEIKYRAVATLIAAGVSLGLSFILTYRYGAIGAAVAIFIGNFVGLVMFMNVVYYKVLNINIFRFFKECHCQMLLPLILTTAIATIIQYFFPVRSFVLFMLKASIVGVIYFVLMWTIFLNQYEKGLLLDTYKKIRRR